MVPEPILCCLSNGNQSPKSDVAYDASGPSGSGTDAVKSSYEGPETSSHSSLGNFFKWNGRNERQ